MTREEIQAIENQIDDLTVELYDNSDKQFIPQFPLVFVRVLKKEQKRGLIIAPEIEQNKPVYEGVVLATWGAKTFEHSKIDSDGNRYTKRVVRESQFSIGDHVLFPHWCGAPVNGLDDKLYRVIKETEWDFSKDGGIIGVVRHAALDDQPRGILLDIIEEQLGQSPASAALANKIFERLILVDRDRPSLTLSGR